MVEQDTIRLLRECDSGIKMGVSSIDEVMDYVSDGELKERLTQCKREHEDLKDQVQKMLNDYEDDGKNPNPMAKGMSWVKTNVMLAVNRSDGTIADLMTDGCNMGVKSLNRYLNRYKAADEKSKTVTKQLIRVEEQLAQDIRSYL